MNLSSFYSFLKTYPMIDLWVYVRKIRLFFYLRYIWANFSFCILMISKWFKTKVRFGLSNQLFLKLSKFREKTNIKAWFRDSFSLFSMFFKLRNESWYQLQQTFLIYYQYFRSWATFLLAFWCLNHAVTMSLHQGYIWHASIAA